MVRNLLEALRENTTTNHLNSTGGQRLSLGKCRTKILTDPEHLSWMIADGYINLFSFPDTAVGHQEGPYRNRVHAFLAELTDIATRINAGEVEDMATVIERYNQEGSGEPLDTVGESDTLVVSRYLGSK
jgi:hypothetical protein